ncbi:glycoside hydrolase family 2 protein [Actinotalea sp. K2]|uniref:glycoside hydrolase family 2 protein n=1 Tax=Actinotalea sp. K2 TaxID=2939438 RepID=UPI002017417B|nr:glycoside hydrolase family 2 protein [Actinotalea sp. K2]MCL3863300.1 glycoside hydrolase family 2 protein [Actinotalea sp. K2]
MIIPLNGSWTLRAVAGPVPHGVSGRPILATVPGTVHTDLLAAGLIPDPFDGDNESLLAWIGLSSWEYTREFHVDLGAAERHDLVCEGLDTVTGITVNGAVVGRTANQHRTYRFDLRGLLNDGANRISVRFESAVEYASRMEAVYGALPHTNQHPFNSIRKTASNFGWDWGIDAVTAGIWRDIWVDSWSGVRVTRLAVTPDLLGTTGRLSVVAEFEQTGEESVELTVATGQASSMVSVKPRSVSASLTLEVPDVTPWWPAGYGDQVLHDVAVSLRAGKVVDAHTRRVGFRCVTVTTTPDEHGTPFELAVNGRPVLVRGANWIPDDAFVPRVTPDRYLTRLTDAIEANINLLRVWGGGVYEDTAFYEFCDEHGLLVWQDFMFACAAYTEREPLRTEVEEEAIDAIIRLSPHPSLVIWNGNNENIWGYVDWGWRQVLEGRTWGDGYYTRLLPDLVRSLDGTRAYTAGSPFSFDRYIHPNDPSHGTTHIWDVWNSRDYTGYADYAPRFVAEFGFQGPPAWSTLTRVVHDEPLDAHGSQMLVHQKASDGNAKLQRGYLPHFPEPKSIEDWHWTAQLNQAHAVRFGIERFRSLFPLNSGMIVWQLNDNWPVISWSAVDYDGHRKPLWYAMKQGYAPRLATIQDGPDAPQVILLNDTDEGIDGRMHLRRLDLHGRLLAEATETVRVEPRDSTRVPLPEALRFENAGDEVLVCDLPGYERAVRYSGEVREQSLIPDAFSVLVERGDGELRVVVLASAVVRDLWLAADQLSPAATVTTGLIHLLPGEVHAFTVTGPVAEVAADDVVAALWCANQLIRDQPGCRVAPGESPEGAHPLTTTT